MEIKDLLQNYISQNLVEKPVVELTQRQELIKRFVDRLNGDRKGKYKALSPRFYAIKMAQSGITSITDLYWFYRYCEDAKDFSSCWWWSLSAKSIIIK